MRLTKKNGQRLDGKRIAALAADGFELIELIVPRKALESAGATVEVVSLHSGRIRGMNLTEPSRKVRVDRVVDDADAASYDALLLPGGFIGPDFVRQSEAARAFVRQFDAEGKPIATLCHGPWVLVSAGVVGDRRLASWPGIRDDVVNAGGTWRDEPLVRDGNWVSSRGPQDLHAFVPAMLELFASGALASRPARAKTGDAVSSPQAKRPLELAVKAASHLPGPALRTVIAAALVAAAGAFAWRRAAMR
jgi:protease I